MNNRNESNRTIKIVVIIVLLIAVAAIFVLGSLNGFNRDDDFEQGYTGTAYIELAAMDGEIMLVGDVVEDWLAGKKNAIDLYNEYYLQGRVYSSRNVVLYYSIFNLSDVNDVVSQRVELSENPAFENAEIYELGKDKRNVQLEYLNVDTTYYYRITAFLSDGSQINADGKFETADTPRVISFANPRNVRDIGGWSVSDGGKIKQGMIYRGSELDGVTQSKMKASHEDIRVLKDELGIRTELDLRGTDDSFAGNVLDVTYKAYAFSPYSDCLSTGGQQALSSAIKELAVEENYPVYVHCTYGADMTGTLCFFVEALLGVNEQDMYTDWELSALCNGSGAYDEMDKFLERFDKLAGDTMQEKACNYLLSIGVTQQEIDSIREILLED